MTQGSNPHLLIWQLPWCLSWQSVCLQCRRPGFNPRVRKVPWRRKLQPTPVLLPGKPHGRRSLVGYNPRGRRESNTTEQFHFHFTTDPSGKPTIPSSLVETLLLPPVLFICLVLEALGLKSFVSTPLF